MSSFKDLPQILGSADPIRYTQLLPSVQTNSIHDSGLHIQGCDNSHNAILLDGITIYNPTHLFGLFSVFNPTHYSSFVLKKTPYLSTEQENRLGGMLNMFVFDSNRIVCGEEGFPTKDRISGDVSIGLISSQGTLSVPVGSKSLLKVSARSSFLHPLYSEWLKFDNTKLTYGFQDYNISWAFRPLDRDLVYLDIYRGSDDLLMSEYSNDDNSFNWGNTKVSLHWDHSLKNKQGIIMQSIYFTGYECNLDYKYNDLHLTMPSSIWDWGYKASFSYGRLNFRTDFTNHTIQPQKPVVHRNSEYKRTKENLQHSYEWNAAVDYERPISSNWSLLLGAKTTIYAQKRQTTYWNIDPNITIQYLGTAGTIIRAYYGWQHQYLFQTGFSNLGLPTEFWYSSCDDFKPQYSQHIAVSYHKTIKNGDYSITSDLYYRQLWRQIEYIGSVYDLFYDDLQDIKVNLNAGRGWNYGISFMANKQTGNLTGWLGLNFGRSLRQFDDSGRVFPSSHERIFEANGLATWHITPHWTLSATGTLASGTPFTAPLYFYVLNDRLLSQYSEYNDNRLPMYKRIDMSIGYSIPLKNSLQMINVSIYNLFAMENPIFYRLKFREGEYGYISLTPLYLPMPSISYNIKF